MELDDLKSAWKNVPSEKKYDQKAIFEMMKKKSSSTIKSLFIFTSIEFVLVISFTLISIIKGKLLLGNDLDINDSFYTNYIIGSVFTMIITLIFLIVTYLSYRKIHIDNTVKDLIKQLIKFRRIINLFILLILFSLIFISVPYYYNLGQQLYIDKIGENYDIEKAETVGSIAVLVAIIFIIIITSVYYFFIYWFFLRKLSKNLKDLKDIK